VIDIEDIRDRYHCTEAFLDERWRRLFAANEAVACGHGGVTAAAATGLARSRINRGIRELQSGQNPIGNRVRRSGGGRKSDASAWLTGGVGGADRGRYPR
jgi:hypothetical protein